MTQRPDDPDPRNGNDHESFEDLFAEIDNETFESDEPTIIRVDPIEREGPTERTSPINLTPDSVKRASPLDFSPELGEKGVTLMIWLGWVIGALILSTVIVVFYINPGIKTGLALLVCMVATVLIVRRTVHLSDEKASQLKIVGARIGWVASILAIVVCVAIAVVEPSVKTIGILLVIVIATILTSLQVFRQSEDDAWTEAKTKLENPVTPSRRASRILDDDEDPWREDRLHPIVLTPWVLGWFVLVALCLIYTSGRTMLYLLGLITLVAAVAILLWMRNHRCFTEWRVFTTEGLIGRTMKQMSYANMTDVKLHVPWHSVILSKLRVIRLPYGTLILESAGQKQALERLHFTKDIELIHQRMSRRTRETEEG
jgi:hypothetical protein